MRKAIRFVVVPLAVAVAAAVLMASGSAEEKVEKPRVVILATGGTIAGAAKKSTDAGYKAGQVSVDVLIEAVPQLKTVARVTGEQISNVGSQDMSDDVWLRLAKRVNAILADEKIAGIVVTHGTDTMEETAYFLHLVTASDKPVVLTGAMRPSTSISADGALNIYNAVAVAASPSSTGRGALVAIDSRIHSARYVRQTHTSSIPGFSSPGAGPIGTVQYGKVRFKARPERKHTTASPFRVDEAESLPIVSILYAHANLSGVLVDAAVKSGAKGIVLAGVGNGNASGAMLDALEKAAKAGVAVVRSSRVLAGPTGRNVEIDDDARGFVAADTLPPMKARILLMLALAAGTKSSADLQAQFYEF